jgi:hypothetical protein
MKCKYQLKSDPKHFCLAEPPTDFTRTELPWAAVEFNFAGFGGFGAVFSLPVWLFEQLWQLVED